MRSKPLVIFWGATAAAILFLGAVWSTTDRLGSAGHGTTDAIVLAMASIGLAVSLFVAGRIAVVMGRVRRGARRDHS